MRVPRDCAAVQGVVRELEAGVLPRTGAHEAVCSIVTRLERARHRADRRTDMPDSGSEWVSVPSLRLDWLHGRSSIEAEAGAELGSRSLPTTSERRTRYFFSLGYRLSLDTRR